MRKWIVLLALALVAAQPAAADPCPGAAADSGCQLAAALGDAADRGQAILRQPQALALDADGNLLVGDRWGYAFQRFDPGHAPTGAWGEYGEADGQFGAIGGLAAAPDGSVYALDTDHNRVERWVPDGGGYRYDRGWGGKGSDGRGPADFDIRFTGDVAVGPGPRVYVADTYNHRVAYYDAGGRYLGQLGETGVPGSDAAHFRYPQGLAVDAAGDVYVADDRNDRIAKFSPAGAPLAQIGRSGELQNPYDAGVDAAGNVYVADNLDHRVVKYAPDAGGLQYSPAATWGGRGDAPGQMLTPRSIVVQPDGTNYVTDTGNGRIEVFDGSGAPLAGSPFGLNGRDGGHLTGPMGISFDAAGPLLVADALEYRVQRLGADGSSAGWWGSHGDGPEQLWLAEGVARAADGGGWVADTGNDRVQHFDPQGNSVVVVPGLDAPRGVATDAAGNVYVADTGAGRIVKLDPNGAQLAAWSAGLQTPADVEVAANGALLVADTGLHRVVVLDPGGNVAGGWGGEGTNADRPGPGPFDAPEGIAADAAGNVYVADSGAARVSRFAPDGTWLASFGSRGHGPGQFWTGGPRDVAASDGAAMASDPYDNEIDRFTLPPASQAPALAAGRAWDVGAASATVGAALDTHGLGTTYWLDLGETSAYGRRLAVASSRANGPVSAVVAVLAPHRTYHYRFVAAGPAGLTYGPDTGFTTAPAIQLRAAVQRLAGALRHGIVLRVRAGETGRASLSLTITRTAARRIGLHPHGATVRIAHAAPRLLRNRWTTVHVRMTRRLRALLAREPHRLQVLATARASAPAGSAVARFTAR